MKRASRRGFTLLEMMIALAAGAAILLVAVAGFRSASQIVRLAQVLQAENQSIATGISLAFDELDYWRQYDGWRPEDDITTMTSSNVNAKTRFCNRAVIRDPGCGFTSPQNGNPGIYTPGSFTTGTVHGDTSGTPQPNTRRLGLPFSPFGYNDLSSVSLPYTVSWGVGATTTTGQGCNDFGRGWQDNELLWVQTADNPLTWWTGLGMQRCYGNVGNMTEVFPGFQWRNDRFGRYQIFGVSASSGRPAYSAAGGADAGVVVPVKNRVSAYGKTTCDYSTTDSRSEYGWESGLFSRVGEASITTSQKNSLEKMRRQNPGWISDKIRGSRNALGDYGMFDYLPVNIMYTYMISDFSTINNNPDEQEQADGGGRIFFMATTYRYDGYDAWNYVEYKPGTYFSQYAAGQMFECHGWQSMPYDFNVVNFTMCRTMQPMACARDALQGRQPEQLEIDTVRYWANRNGFLLGPALRSQHTKGPYSDADLNFRYGMRANGGFVYNILQARWEDEYNPKSDLSLAAKVAGFMDLNSSVASAMPIYPKNWPSVSLASGHYLFRGRLNNQVKVGWVDAKGNLAELKFSGMGSTLRGARRQRPALEYPGRTPEN